MITSVWSQPGQPHPAAERVYREVFPPEQFPGALSGAGPMALHLTLELDGETVAAGALCYVSSGTGRLAMPCVRARWRKQGLGDGLIKILHYKAETLELRVLTAETPREHLDFFRRLGYRPTGEERDCGGRSLLTVRKELGNDTGENCAHQCACQKVEN